MPIMNTFKEFVHLQWAITGPNQQVPLSNDPVKQSRTHHNRLESLLDGGDQEKGACFRSETE